MRSHNAASSDLTAEAIRQDRIQALDVVRGLALILMALDHAAFFSNVGVTAEHHVGVETILESWPHWVTGLLTNIAAPIFWFLAGASLSLFIAGCHRKRWAEPAITRFLLIRAGLIFAVDLAVGLVWGWSFNVLSSLALCIAIMSVARFLPVKVIGAVGLALLIGYEWLWRNFGYTSAIGDPFWSAIWITPNNGLLSPVPFSVLGWGGVLALGYAVTDFLRARQLLQSPRVWLALAGGLFTTWLLVRLTGRYGNIVPRTAGRPWYDVLIMSKEPVSLAYLTFNLTWMCVILAGLFALPKLLQKRPTQLLAIVGQASLFFYGLHVVLYNFIGGSAVDVGLFNHIGIVRAYFVWVLGLCILVPLSMGFRTVKKRHSASILRYI